MAKNYIDSLCLMFLYVRQLDIIDLIYTFFSVYVSYYVFAISDKQEINKVRIDD